MDNTQANSKETQSGGGLGVAVENTGTQAQTAQTSQAVQTAPLPTTPPASAPAAPASPTAPTEAAQKDYGPTVQQLRDPPSPKTLQAQLDEMDAVLGAEAGPGAPMGLDRFLPPSVRQNQANQAQVSIVRVIDVSGLS